MFKRARLINELVGFLMMLWALPSLLDPVPKWLEFLKTLPPLPEIVAWIMIVFAALLIVAPFAVPRLYGAGQRDGSRTAGWPLFLDRVWPFGMLPMQEAARMLFDALRDGRSPRVQERFEVKTPAERLDYCAEILVGSDGRKLRVYGSRAPSLHRDLIDPDEAQWLEFGEGAAIFRRRLGGQLVFASLAVKRSDLRRRLAELAPGKGGF